MDENGLPLNNRPPKILAEKGKKQVLSLSSVERGENVTVVACCNASGSYIPPLIIFKGKRQKPEMQTNLPNGSLVCMSQIGYTNEDIFLKSLEHFQRHRVPGRVLLILDVHCSHSILPALEYCHSHKIEITALPLHTTHVLQPLDRTVFKSLKTNYHQESTMWLHKNPGCSITKIQLCSLFIQAWKRTASVGLAVNGFLCTGIYPFRPEAIEDFRFSPSEIYDSSTVPDPASVPVTSIEIPSSSNEPEDHNPSQTLRKVLPSPEKVPKKSSKRAKSKVCHATSPENIASLKEKKQRKSTDCISTLPTRISDAVTKKNTIARKRLRLVESPASSSEDESIENGTEEEVWKCGFCNIIQKNLFKKEIGSVVSVVKRGSMKSALVQKG